MCQFSGKTDNFDFFCPNLPKNEFRVGNSENQYWNKNDQPRDTMCANLQAKWTTFNFLAQICSRMDLGLQTQKTNVGIRISILEILCLPIFKQNGQLWLFLPKFPQKWTLVSEFQKSKRGFGISTSKIPCVPIFNFEFFHLNLGKLPNYM